MAQAAAFREHGVTTPKRILFYGPPGTGKTLTARVLAAQSGLAFIGCTTADIKQQWIGASGQKVKEIFASARASDLADTRAKKGTRLPKADRPTLSSRQQNAGGVRPDIADLVMLDRLLNSEQAELALGASVVERDVQRAEGVPCFSTSATMSSSRATSVRANKALAPAEVI